MSRHIAPEKASPFNFRRNLAISVAGLLVLVIASSGTAAASNDALPDQPLYGVKMAVEQAQLTLAVSDVDKAELYANLADKRAHEIEALARQGKADYLASTSARMDYQLEQAENYITKYQASTAAGPPATTNALPSGTSTAETGNQTTQTSPAPVAPATGAIPEAPPAGTATTEPAEQPVQPVPATTTQVKPPSIPSDNKSGVVQPPVKRPLPAPHADANISRAKTTLNSSTAKSLAALQDALDKAPESAKPAIIKAIEHVKKAHQWSQNNQEGDQGQNDKPDVFVPRPNDFPVKPSPDAVKPNRDSDENFVPPDKPKYTPPKHTNQNNPASDSSNQPDTATDTQVIKNTINTAVSPDTHGHDDDSSLIKGFSK